jgi:hypothetical protein
MLMVLAGTAVREEVEIALERAGVSGYTEVDARGIGSSGRHLGSAAFPKTSRRGANDRARRRPAPEGQARREEHGPIFGS